MPEKAQPIANYKAAAEYWLTAANAQFIDRARYELALVEVRVLVQSMLDDGRLQAKERDRCQRIISLIEQAMLPREPGETIQLMSIAECGEKTNHAQRADTGFCSCTHKMFGSSYGDGLR